MPKKGRMKTTLKSRKIGGKKFAWKGWGHSKARANEIAKNQRKLGWNVRVIPSGKSKNLTRVWDIFARKKKIRKTKTKKR